MRLTNEELAAAFAALNESPWLLLSVWGSFRRAREGVEGLSSRGLISEGRLEEVASLIRTLSKPKLMADVFTVDFEGGTMSRESYVAGEGTFLLRIGNEFIWAERSELNLLDRPTSVMRPILLDGRELMVLFLILTMDIYSYDVPGLAPFTADDVQKRVEVGSHIPLNAQIILIGGKRAPKLKVKDVKKVLRSLVEKGVLISHGNSLSISEEFLPAALALGSPDRIRIISITADPESDDPDLRTIAIYELGSSSVAMDILDGGKGIVVIGGPLSDIPGYAGEVHGKICPNCGHVNRGDAKFCIKCGTRLA